MSATELKEALRTANREAYATYDAAVQDLQIEYQNNLAAAKAKCLIARKEAYAAYIKELRALGLNEIADNTSWRG